MELKLVKALIHPHFKWQAFVQTKKSVLPRKINDYGSHSVKIITPSVEISLAMLCP